MNRATGDRSRLLGRLAVTVMALCGGISANASPESSLCDADCVAVGVWHLNVGVGLGLRLNPLTEADDTPLLVLPEVSYYGRRFFLRNLEMGFTLLETSRHQVNLLATPSYDQMYFNRWDPLNLTFAGGAGMSPAPAAAPPAYDYSHLSISSSRQPHGGPTVDSGGGGLPASPGAGDSVDPKDGAPSESPPSSETLRFNGSIRSDALLEINGNIILSSTTLSGAEGNSISVTMSDRSLIIDGISASDRVNFTAESAVLVGDISGDVSLHSAIANDLGRVNIVTNEEAFVVTSAAPEEPDAAEAEAVAPRVAYDSVSKRRISGLAGLEYSYTTDWMSVHFQGLQDVTRVHHGQEYRVAVVFPWTFTSQKWALTLGANHRSQKLLDYYYGIDGNDALTTGVHYEVASAGTETLARLDWQKPVSAHWTLRAKVQYMGLPAPIRHSPLVAKDYVLSVFVGGVYHF